LGNDSAIIKDLLALFAESAPRQYRSNPSHDHGFRRFLIPASLA
jgi:hypothetical protein